MNIPSRRVDDLTDRPTVEPEFKVTQSALCAPYFEYTDTLVNSCTYSTDHVHKGVTLRSVCTVAVD